MSCGPLKKPDHGDIIEQVALTFGNRIVFECKDIGYEMKGSRVRTCQKDGMWSGSLTTCERELFIMLCHECGPHPGFLVKGNAPYLYLCGIQNSFTFTGGLSTSGLGLEMSVRKCTDIFILLQAPI